MSASGIPRPQPIEDDLVLLFAALAATTQDAVTEAVTSAGFDDLRPSHGYVFQHLQQGPATIGELARRLAVTPQAASKVVGELAGRGYLTSSPATTDQRRRLVELTPRAWESIAVARRARARLNTKLRRQLGPDAATFVTRIRELADRTGALDTLANRRLRPPR